MELDDLFVTVKQEPEIYTQEEWVNQYGLDPMSFANIGE
jgi:hypothetical protein